MICLISPERFQLSWCRRRVATYRPVLLSVRHELQALVHVRPHLVNMGHRVDGPGVVWGHRQTLQRRDLTWKKQRSKVGKEECYISVEAEPKGPSERWKCPPHLSCRKVEGVQRRICNMVQITCVLSSLSLPVSTNTQTHTLARYGYLYTIYLKL